MTRDTMANVKESHVIILFISFLVLLMSFQCAKNEHTDVSPLADYSIKDCGKAGAKNEGAKNEHTDVSPLRDYAIKDCKTAGCVFDDVDIRYCWCGITSINECCTPYKEVCDLAVKQGKLHKKCIKPGS
ncbi:hypothetical protein HanPSC8_Chr15g0644541 [Helianthus annuus]|nr:hypothetical protein HanIR_Chr15g0729231 [Helianthus annuus]KAJ0829491.1 hypothetical protein HanPSC8_Chr15g0644541 [Helianthus annuus]